MGKSRFSLRYVRKIKKLLLAIFKNDKIVGCGISTLKEMDSGFADGDEYCLVINLSEPLSGGEPHPIIFRSVQVFYKVVGKIHPQKK